MTGLQSFNFASLVASHFCIVFLLLNVTDLFLVEK
jgi:hypothetical protein